MQTVVDAARLRPDDLVLEAGAGRGALTRALVGRCRLVIAYELDPTLCAELTERLRDDPRVRCVPGDFLAAAPPGGPFVVVGNIPYAGTAGVVQWCLRAPGLTAATLVTQWEYARRRTGGYGRWSRLTVRTWPWFEWSLAGRIDRRAFHPVPAVDAGLLRLRRRPAALLPAAERGAYHRFVDLGFTGIGGSLYASLATRHRRHRLAAAFQSVRLSIDTPVGHVWPEQWLAVFRAVRR